MSVFTLKGSSSLDERPAPLKARLFCATVVFLFVSCATAMAPTVKRIPSVHELTLDQKIGQLFMYGVNGSYMAANSREYQQLLHQVRDNHVGGIIWFQAKVLETAFYTRRMQAEAEIPLLVATDLEAGIGMRFMDTTFWPYAMAIGATGDPMYAELTGKWAAREGKLLGINHIYAPVADVSNNPDNPIINTRSFGEDPEMVSRFVAAFVRGIESEGVLATAKHFPGHGDTQTDSHRALPVLNVSRSRLDQIELGPFRAAIDAGVSSVMTAHMALPQLDPTPAPPVRQDVPGDHAYAATEEELAEGTTLPASLSRSITTGVLREDLGFDGLIVTDALDMGAITRQFDPGEAAVRAIESGADQVLKSINTDAAIAGVKAAVQSGRISAAQIDAAAERVLRAKTRVSLIVPSDEEIFQKLDSPEARAVALEIAIRAVTLVREQANVLPILREARVVHVHVTDQPEAVPPLVGFETELRRRLERPPVGFTLDRSAGPEQVNVIADAAAVADLVIFSYTVRFRDGKGSISAPPVARETAERVAQLGKPMIGISFGTPYLLRDVPILGTYLVAYGVQPVMQRAVSQALFGEQPITGRLPVSIPGLYPIGHGIERGRDARSASVYPGGRR